MIAPISGVRAWLWPQPVDFRKGHEGLAALVQMRLARDPCNAYPAGRGTTHAAGHLKTFGGVLEVDGYRAYKTLVADRAASKDARPITLALCWSRSRRRFRDATRQGASPVAEEALRRIGELYRIKADIRGLSAEERLASRRARSAPVIEDLKRWLDDQADRLSRKTPVGDAVHYARRNWVGLRLVLEDGRVEIDSNAVERSFKPRCCCARTPSSPAPAAGPSTGPWSPRRSRRPSLTA